MISITCSRLEAVRNNPIAYGQLLASNDGKKSGGTYGMLACFQEAAKPVHAGELTVHAAVKNLINKFSRFQDNEQNQARQKKLLNQFVKYFDNVRKQKLEWADGKHKINWQLLPDAKLTGITPWVLKNDKAYHSFLFTETNFPWQQQLRFPLFQQYLVDNNIDTTANKMQVGIYSLSDSTFQTKNFTLSELNAAIDETSSVIKIVYDSYSIKKKKN